MDIMEQQLGRLLRPLLPCKLCPTLHMLTSYRMEGCGIFHSFFFGILSQFSLNGRIFMIEKLFGLLKKPALWQRSCAPFWDDEHISKGMLEAHLDPNRDAASRRRETIDRSAAWLSAVIPAGSSVLDLGCGPGLYTERLSAWGYQVTGMDLSRRSIDYAREHDPRSRYFCKNYLELDSREEFDAATMIYCDYGALTEEERSVLLQRVFRALRPGGMFVFDVFSREHFRDREDTTSWSVQENGGFWSPEPHLCLEASYLYDGGTVAADQCVVVTDHGWTEYLIWDTAYTEKSLKEELLAAGFQVKDILDDVCGRPYTGGGDTLCAVAAKPR